MNLREARDLAYRSRWAGTRNEDEAYRISEVILSDVGAGRPVSAITSLVLASLVERWRAKGLAGATINRRMSALGAILRAALDAGALDRLPRLPRFREERREAPEVTLDDLRRALVRLEPEPARAVQCLFETGARCGELLRARRGDLDLERAEWSIPTSKNGKPRVVPLGSRAHRAFSVQLWSRQWAAGEAIWTLNPGKLWKRWEAVRDDAGLSGVRLHDLRHAFATRLVRAKVDIYRVSRLLGHASVKTTERYLHLATDDLASAIAAIE